MPQPRQRPAPHPGVGELTVEVILSGIALDTGRFPSAGHLISWAGLCPRQDESAGKRRSTEEGHLRRRRLHLTVAHMLGDGLYADPGLRR